RRARAAGRAAGTGVAGSRPGGSWHSGRHAGGGSAIVSEPSDTVAGMDPRVDLPLRSVAEHALSPPELSPWLRDLPAVRDVLSGFEFDRTTVFVGENGSGKSTIIEAIATALDLPPGGGSGWEVRDHVEAAPELSGHLQIVRGATTNRRGFLLRAQPMHETNGSNMGD